MAPIWYFDPHHADHGRERRRGDERRTLTDWLEPQPLLYTINEAMRSLRIGRTKVYEEIDAGRLELVMAGGCRRFTAAGLQRYVMLLQTEAASPARLETSSAVPE